VEPLLEGAQRVRQVGHTAAIQEHAEHHIFGNATRLTAATANSASTTSIGNIGKATSDSARRSSRLDASTVAGVPRYAVYVLGLMVATNCLNYVDRWVGSAVAPLIQAELHLSDFGLGLLGSTFTLVYALGALPFGLWADRGARRVVIGTGVAVWSTATLLSGLASGLAQLVATRALLGLGEGGYYPAGTSLLGDYVPRALRGRAMSIWGAGAAVGIALGFAGGGLLAASSGWRAAFFVCAAPGLVLAILAFRLREPFRGAAEGVPAGDQTLLASASVSRMLGLLRIASLRWTILSQTALFFVLGANAYWLPTLLVRRFGMSVSEAGTLAGAVIVLGGLIGTLVGGWVADWRRRHSARADLEVGILGFLGGAACVSVALLAPASWFVPAFLLAVICLYLYSGPFAAIGQNVVVPPLRASAVTVGLLIEHLLGDSYAAAAVGLLSDVLGSLQMALLVISPTLLLLAAGVAALGLGTIHADTRNMDRQWAGASMHGLTRESG
jgi:MFS transporter, Spinster family, sphingosine-1-phosphate transporter